MTNAGASGSMDARQLLLSCGPRLAALLGGGAPLIGDFCFVVLEAPCALAAPLTWVTSVTSAAVASQEAGR